MKAERLHELADAYGADLRRWPASERAFAESLIAADPSLKAVLDQAAALDALLDAAPRPVPSAALTARMEIDCSDLRSRRLSGARHDAAGKAIGALEPSAFAERQTRRWYRPS